MHAGETMHCQPCYKIDYCIIYLTSHIYQHIHQNDDEWMTYQMITRIFTSRVSTTNPPLTSIIISRIDEPVYSHTTSFPHCQISGDFMASTSCSLYNQSNISRQCVFVRYRFIVICCVFLSSQIAIFMEPTGGPPGSCRPRCGPCWPHEPCYQGWLNGVQERNKMYALTCSYPTEKVQEVC